MILESLYQPSRKDRLAGLAQRRYIERLVISATGTLLSVNSSDCPADVIRVIHGCAGAVQPGTGQQVIGIVLRLLVAGTGIEVASFAPLPWGGGAFGAGTECSVDANKLDLIVLPGEALTLVLQTTGGANPRNAQFGVYGYEIPRANVQR